MCEDAVPEGLSPDTLKQEFISVAARLGVEKLQLYNIPNTNFPQHRQEILSELNKIKREFEPHLVIMPALSDPHQDHRTIAEEVLRVFIRDASIIGYELPWSNSAFNPQLLVRLTKKQMEEKWRILSLYKSQFVLKSNYFTKEFIFSWARMRGVQCNSLYAEAFEVVRWMMHQP
jgi:LmbE family N-acetylglucosaminyl deacetylase